MLIFDTAVPPIKGEEPPTIEGQFITFSTDPTSQLFTLNHVVDTPFTSSVTTEQLQGHFADMIKALQADLALA
jgi:hypothetical protein